MCIKHRQNLLHIFQLAGYINHPLFGCLTAPAKFPLLPLFLENDTAFHSVGLSWTGHIQHHTGSEIDVPDAVKGVTVCALTSEKLVKRVLNIHLVLCVHNPQSLARKFHSPYL